MPSMTNSEYLAYLARHQCQPGAQGGCDDEAELHQQIAAECLRRGWLAIHGRMDCASSVTVGAPDFVIMTDRCVHCGLSVKSGACQGVLDHGLTAKTLYIEAKTKVGKLSPPQLAFHAWAKKLGHTVHVVRRFEEFCELL